MKKIQQETQENFTYTMYDMEDGWLFMTRQEKGDNCIYFVQNDEGCCLFNTQLQHKYEDTFNKENEINENV